MEVPPPRPMLLISDDMSVRRRFEAVAAAGGYPVASAPSDREIEGSPPAVIIDVNREDSHMSSALATLGLVSSETPCLLVTDRTEVALPSRPELDRVLGVIRAPWTPEHVGSMLRYALEVKRQRSCRPAPAVRELSILLVEDDDVDVVWICELIAPMSPLVHRARDLRGALDLVEQHPFDLLLCDLGLPDARGIDVVRSLHRTLPDVPLVVITGAPDDAVALQAVRFGAQDCLAKDTLDERTLIRAVSYALERSAIKKEIAFLARHDPLTSLANRVLFKERLERSLVRAERLGEQVAVLLVDLDRFKIINDTFGHELGDHVLCAAAERMTAVVRGYDTVARFGGDEFAIIVDMGASTEAAHEVARRVVAAISKPVVTPRASVTVGASVGVAEYPRDATTGDELVRAADTAMYSAKAAGGSRWAACSNVASLNRKLPARLSARLRRAEVGEDLHLVFQPEVCLHTGATLGWEAMLRARGSSDESAAELIPVLENNGQMLAAGAWVVQEACRALRSCAVDEQRIAINISAAEFAAPDFVNRVLEPILDSGVDPGRLDLELSEACLSRDLPHSVETTRRLAVHGVKVVVDGFGAGPMSMLELRRLRVSGLKLSPQIADDLPLLRAVVGFGHDLGARVCAKGIERDSQLRAIRAASCDSAQGFLFAPPRPELSCDIEFPVINGRLSAHIELPDGRASIPEC